MLQNLINLVKQQANSSIINNPVIPDERNEEAVTETSNSIMQTLQSALSGNNMKDLLSMFANGKADEGNPVVQQASGNVIDRLKTRFGLNTEQASGVAGSLVPGVMNQLAQKTADPADNSFDIQDIFSQLSGGKTAGLNLQGLLSKFRGGLDRDGDGDVDLNDLRALVAGEGSLTDKVRGMFN